MRDAGFSPASTTASPGLMPRCARRAASLLTAESTSAARDLPSRMRAAMGARSLPFEHSVLSCRPPARPQGAPVISKTRAQEHPMPAVPQLPAANDPDSQETQEWLDALEAV